MTDELPAFAADVVTLLEAAGHQRSHSVWDDGFGISPTKDGRAVRISYAIRPDITDPTRSRDPLNDCATVLDEAGYPFTRVSLPRNPHVSEDALVVLPTPVPAAPARAANPAQCACAAKELCERARARAIAARELDRDTSAAAKTLLGALYNAAIEPVSHAPWGPEGAAALLDHSAEVLSRLPAVDGTATFTDPVCEDCSAAACVAANSIASAAIGRAAHLAAVHRSSDAAAHMILNRATLDLTPGDRWQAELSAAAERLMHVYLTAAEALARPRTEVGGRTPGRRRPGDRPNLYSARGPAWRFSDFGPGAWWQ